MKKIILISCVSKKRDQKSKACDLYISPLFQKNLQYAQLLAPDKVFILSAKYGLAELEQEIEPYDLTLNNMSTALIRRWAAYVLHQMAEQVDLKEDRFIFLAGEKYRRYLIPYMRHVEIPLEGLSIGRQLQRLNELIEGRNYA
jgi:hypothetical protein